MGPNAWPDGVPGFREAIAGHYAQATKVAQCLFVALAEMLDLPPDTFARHATANSRATMRLLHYAPGALADAPAATGISAHTDFECFSMLHQEAAGLELRSRTGAWGAAPVPGPDEVLVFVGGALCRRTAAPPP